MSETYKPESPANPPHPHLPGAGSTPEHHTAVPYIVVWVLLCGLTFLTVMTGKQHLGSFALPLALAIASVKSILVLLFFMHLWEQKGAPRLIIGMSVAFALLLMFFTVTDVATRFGPLTPRGAPFGGKVVLPAQPVVEPGEPRPSPWVAPL